MPRLVLKDGMERRRCNVACDSCRKRKEKCDSRQPCAGCVKRGIDCVFAPPTPASDAPSNKRRRSKTDQEHESFQGDKQPNTNSDISSTANRDRRWSTIADGSGFQANGMPSPRSPMLETPEVPVPHMPRLLLEQHGSVVYVGGSASLSFLQNVQHIVFSAIGDCEFVTDPLLQSFLDVPPTRRDDAKLFERLGSNGFANGQLVLSLEQADMLAHQFLIASSALLDLFDTTALFRSIQEWLEANSFSELCRPVIYFVMAIGASVTATNGWDEIAEQYFNAGRQLALDGLTREPSLNTIQAFVLMTLYMIGTTQPNAAFVTLGTAIRTAYAIGLHRSDLQHTFPEPERHSRERVWRSLRALDLFLSTALGRPSATTDHEKEIEGTDGGSSVSDASHGSANGDNTLPSPAITGLCSIFERILTDVYKQQAVSIRVADEITRLYRQLSARLPNAYGSIPNDGTFPATYAELAKRVATTRVMATYHWSIILLARPFLTAHISSHVQRNKGNTPPMDNNALSSGRSSILSYAEFGIDSAIRSLDIAAELLQLPGLPRRLPFVTESIFNSALTVGAAYFGDFDRSYALTDAMNKAQNLLAHLSAFDCQARCFQHFVATLSNAAKVFMEHRDRSSMENRQMRKNSIFGIVGADSPTSFSPIVTTFAQANLQSTTSPGFSDPKVSPNFSGPKIGTGDWSRAATARPAPQAFPSPPDGDFGQGFHITDMVPTPPDSRSDEQTAPGMLDQPHLDFLLRTSGAEFMNGTLTAHSGMSQGYPSEFNMLTSDMSTDVDMLPMFDLLGEPILF